jgi:hypothetical protein
MGFLVPAFLAGLAAVIVPIVLHLRHRDKDTPHRFPSLMFVERLPIRTAQRRRITDWPLLLLRALAIVLLVLAFARPLWWKPALVRAAAQPRTEVLLLDRSASMGHRAVWRAAQDSVRASSNRLALTSPGTRAVRRPGGERAADVGQGAAARGGGEGDARATRFAAAARRAPDRDRRVPARPCRRRGRLDFQRNGRQLGRPRSTDVAACAPSVSTGARANTSVAVASAARRRRRA